MASGESGDIRPVTFAFEFERPSHGFTDGGGFGNDFGGELERAHRTVEGGGRGGGQWLHLNAGRITGDAVLFGAQTQHEARVGDADIHQLLRRGDYI